MTMMLFDNPKDFLYTKNFKLIQDVNEVGDVLNELDKHDLFALDTETTSLDWMVADLHGISFSVDDRDWYLTGGAEKAILPDLRKLVDSPNKTVAMHNARYDMHILNKWGVRPQKIFDTLIAQMLVDENQRLALKSLAWKTGIDDDLPTYKDLVRDTAKAYKMTQGKVTIDMIPLNRLAPYAARDTRITLDLVPVCIREMQEEGMLDLFWNNEMPMMWVLLDMEETGFQLDIPRLEKMVVEYTDLRDQYYEKIQKAGIENPNSTDQLSDYLFGTLGMRATKFTDKGQPATDIVALRRLMKYKDGEPNLADPNTKFLMDVISYRQSTKILGTYIEPLLDKQHDGRIHTSYNSTSGRDSTYGTVTSRLTSSNPNLQNIPGFGMGSELRYVFIAKDGYSIVVSDYSQLELRLLAHYSKDPNLVKTFMEGGDPHQMTADMIGISRRNAKGVNFGWVYGIGGRGLADAIEKTGAERPNEREAGKWLNDFEVVFPGAGTWKGKVLQWGRKLGYVKTIDGHKRRLPDLTSKLNSERARAERQAPNAVIQGTAASLMRYVMIEEQKILRDVYGSSLVGQVHDELIWEVPTDSVEHMAHKAQVLMESVEDVFNITVPIKADPNYGKSWGDAK